MSLPFYAAAKFSARPARSIRFIILHRAEGSLIGMRSWFQNKNCPTSAHFGVGAYGEVEQYVRTHDIAYHAGNWSVNELSIGVEHAGVGTEPLTTLQMDASIELVAGLLKEHGLIPECVFLHRDVPRRGVHFGRPPLVATACPGQRSFDLVQYRSELRKAMASA